MFGQFCNNSERLGNAPALKLPLMRHLKPHVGHWPMAAFSMPETPEGMQPPFAQPNQPHSPMQPLPRMPQRLPNSPQANLPNASHEHPISQGPHIEQHHPTPGKPGQARSQQSGHAHHPILTKGGGAGHPTEPPAPQAGETPVKAQNEKNATETAMPGSVEKPAMESPAPSTAPVAENQPATEVPVPPKEPMENTPVPLPDALQSQPEQTIPNVPAEPVIDHPQDESRHESHPSESDQPQSQADAETSTPQAMMTSPQSPMPEALPLPHLEGGQMIPSSEEEDDLTSRQRGSSEKQAFFSTDAVQNTRGLSAGTWAWLWLITLVALVVLVVIVM